MSLAVTPHYDLSVQRAHHLPRLKRSALFEKFSDRQLEAIASVFTPCQLAAGEPLFRQGEMGHFMAIVAHGQLELQIEEGGECIFQRCIEPLDIIGEMTCLDPAPRSGSIIARSEAQVLVLDRQSVERLKLEHPAAYSMLLRAIWRRVLSRLITTNEAISQRGEAPSVVPFAKRGDQGARALRYEGEVELGEQDALQHFSAKELDTIAGVARKALYPGGAVVFREGDLGKACYIIVSGEVIAYRDQGRARHELGRLGQGALFGQIALIEHRRRTATILASQDTVTLSLSMMDFDRLTESATPFALRFQELVTISSIRQLRHAGARDAA